MFISKEYKVEIKNFNHNFTGTMYSINTNKNPYLKEITRIAKENQIPEHFIQDTKIMVSNNNVVFTFKWAVEVETPKNKKRKILAYLGDIPEERGDYFYTFVNIEDNIYKLSIDIDDLKNDYILDKAIKIKDEIKYIDSLDIDWIKRYGKALTKLFTDYDFNVSEENIKEFLSLDKVKEFIIEEDEESLSDTSPREVLLDWFEEIKGNDFDEGNLDG